MGTAALAWLAVACLILLMIIVMCLLMVPEFRRYLRIRRM
jgi:hypothetical protein